MATPQVENLEPVERTIGIQALPPTIVKQISSTQVLVDPSSMVKELIDNSLDARATAVFVEISVNTIDIVQVRDNGHGIAPEDRGLICMRYCTSKIRGFDDLKEIGGKSLGFRGEALASMADMAGSLTITTKVEGETVAALLKINRAGETEATVRASHPVGTTVRVTDLFQRLPVRKQAALKHSPRYLAKINHMMQAYALARPAIRFSLRILKAKSNKGDWIYVPKTGGNIKDAAFKVIGKDCALQCDWTALEYSNFEILAFLPRPNTEGSKIANHGSFIAVDSRPVSATRGTLQKVSALYKEHLRRANPSFSLIKDPFMCMNIVCPPGSYDPNIEPAKDDVLFENSEVVLEAVSKLMRMFYPTRGDDEEHPQSAQMVPEKTSTASSSSPPLQAMTTTTGVIHTSGMTPNRTKTFTRRDQGEDAFEADSGSRECSDKSSAAPALDASIPSFPSDEDQCCSGADRSSIECPKKSSVNSLLATPEGSRWHSSMYGFDEEDLDLTDENQTLILDDEENEKAIRATNPWTIAKMNTSMKNPKPKSNPQLLTPAKQPNESFLTSSSPAVPAAQPQPIQLPISPLASSQPTLAESPAAAKIRGGSDPLPPAFFQGSGPDTPNLWQEVQGGVHFNDQLPPLAREPQGTDQVLFPTPPLQSSGIPQVSKRSFCQKNAYVNKPFSSPLVRDDSTQGRSNNYFRTGNSTGQKRTRKRPPPARLDHDVFTYPDEDTPTYSRRRMVIDAAENLAGVLPPRGNRNLRDSAPTAGQHSLQPAGHLPAESFTPINPPPNVWDQLQAAVESGPANARDLNRRPPHTRPADPAPDIGVSQFIPQQRRRTSTANLTRTKSSNLPLERTPRSYRVQHVIFHANPTSIDGLIGGMKRLDMLRNSMPWAQASEEYDSAFLVPVAPARLKEWCVQIDYFLGELYEREDGLDCRNELMKSTRTALDNTWAE